MLTYAFDLLYAMYEEEGYDPSSIANLILKNNLYGIEIDARAGELAAFALTMKARQKSRKFFNNPVEPNICMLKNVQIKPADLKAYVKHVGIDVFTEDVLTTLNQFEEAENFGSLIIPAANNAGEVLKALSIKYTDNLMALSKTHEEVSIALKQADYLSQKYHVVVANPPYMGGRNMNARLSAWLKDNYADVKSDLFSAFIIRNTSLAVEHGQLGFMSPYVWMFISSYEKLRQVLIEKKTITSLIQLEYSGFDGATVPICTFTIENAKNPAFKGSYVRLSDFKGSENQAPKALEAIKNPDCGWFYRVSADDFQKIPGSPIAYWVSEKLRDAFQKNRLSEVAEAKQGMATSDNERFLRIWHEVIINNSCFNCLSHKESQKRIEKWYAYNKGGQFRRWYGNNIFLVNWQYDGVELRTFVEEINKFRPGGRLKNQEYYFSENITYSSLSSGLFSARYNSPGFIFDTKGSCIFPKRISLQMLISFLNCSVAQELLNILCPTLDYSSIGINALPIIHTNIEFFPNMMIQISKYDWDSYETSWDFASLPLLDASYRGDTLASTYSNLRAHWNEMTLEMQRLEEENNRIFIEAYGLEDELTPEVPLKEITLTCNPHYRYGNSKSESELEALLVADTMKELISYAVGCMFGRYSLDKPGLILANQGETYSDYCNLVPDSSFPADPDNAIPVLDGDWFSDDIVSRFRKFLRVTFGEERYEENLRFVEAALGKDLRQYFLRDFYNDHVRRYKKRPIYWMFTSPDGSFNALIYMHRYRSDTVSIVLNEYLREYQVKLTSYMESLRRKESNPDLSKGEKVKALKELDKLSKTQDVLTAYERDVLFPLATQKIEIDLDDGVKVNYPKFGNALKKIAGLEAKVEE